MSDTPRTDAAAIDVWWNIEDQSWVGINDDGHFVPAEVTREIERELNALKATRPEAERIQAALPSGWLPVPVKPTTDMHNAAICCYTPPDFKVEGDGRVYLRSYPPDWSWAWRLMVEAAPSLSEHGPQPRSIPE